MKPKAIVENEAVAVIELEDAKFQQFLKSQKKTTRRTYESYLRMSEFTNNESGSQLLRESKEWKRRIFEFRQWLLDKK
jgi:hypothetical protein